MCSKAVSATDHRLPTVWRFNLQKRLHGAVPLFVANIDTFMGRSLGAFANFHRATISFAMSVRPSVFPHGTTLLPLDGFE